MVKIELNNAKGILDFHYENLTVKNGDFWTIEDFLNNRIKKHSGNTKAVEMFEFLNMKTKKDKNGFSILVAEPKELEKFAKDFETKFESVLDDSFDHTTTRKGKIKTTSISFRKDLEKVFYYGEYDKWKAYELASKIDVKVCPYCNRNYTFVLGTDANKGTRFQYDHFLCKSKYTYLALSFYNLVPSCNVCNSDLKGSEKFRTDTHINPYIEGFGSLFNFSIKPKNVAFVNGVADAYRIKLQKNKKLIPKDPVEKQKVEERIKAMQRNACVFRLQELYNIHKDYVNELIQKSYVYKDDYVEDLYNNYPDLFTSIDDVKRMALGNYIQESDFGKRPLSKLTRDIALELGLLR